MLSKFINSEVINSTIYFDCSICSTRSKRDYYSAIKAKLGNQCKECTSVLSSMKVLDKDKLNSLLLYVKSTGNLTLKRDQVRKNKGDNPTYKHNEGYLSILIGGKEYLAHRIIWFMETGYMPEQVDHINHIRDDNSWDNLREVKHRENQLNMGIKKNNSTGVNGVRILPSGRFCAYIMINRKQISLGTYDTLKEASIARSNADIKYGFHDNHGK